MTATIDFLTSPTPDIYRGPSHIIFGNMNVLDFIEDPTKGLEVFDDFNPSGSGPGAATAFTGSFGEWTLYQGSNSGTIIDAGIIGAGIQFVPSSGTVSSGASTPTVALQSLAGAFQFITNSSGASALQGKLAFECRVALTSITSGQRDAFIGLSDGAPGSNKPFLVLSAGSSNMLASSNNLIGFYNAGSGRGQDWWFVYQKASTAPVFASNLGSLISSITGTAIAAGTFYKLGFVFDPTPSCPTGAVVTASDGQTVGAIARKMIQIYVNGVASATFLTQTQNILTASFPTGIMGPIMAFTDVSNSGTANSGTGSAGVMQVDWIRVAQSLLA
jgi:hypothetical protein